MKTVILAEKPSQAKAYAETFKKKKKQEGYFEVSDPLFTGEVTITYGFGHSKAYLESINDLLDVKFHKQT